MSNIFSPPNFFLALSGSEKDRGEGEESQVREEFLSLSFSTLAAFTANPEENYCTKSAQKDYNQVKSWRKKEKKATSRSLAVKNIFQ